MQSAVPSELAHSPLERLLLKAGATMVARHGWLVAAHYGSPGGELALAETAVGLADRSDMGKFELRGDADAVEQLVGQLTGGQVGPGEAIAATGAWWGAVSGEHVVALCGAADTKRLKAALEDAAGHTHGATVVDTTARLAALALVGPGAGAVLDELSGSGPFDEVGLPDVRRDDARRRPGDAAAQRGDPRHRAHRRGPRRGAVAGRRARRPRGGPRARRRGRDRGGPVSAESEADAGPRTPSDAIAPVRVHAPSERNRKLAAFLEAANADTQLKARWHAAQVTAERLGMSDHSWVHLQIVLNMALRLFRMLRRAGVTSSVEADYALRPNDAEVVIAAGCLLHDLGMSIHRVDHEAYSLFLAADALDRLLEGVYDEPDRTVDRLRGAARDHRPPQGRTAADARGRRSSASPTRSTWSTAARASRSRPTCRTSTRSPRRRSTRCGSCRARRGRSASRSR